MNADELYSEWTSGESNGMRPKRVQAVRDDLAEATGMSVPRRITEIEGWLETMKQSGVITKKLRSASGSSDDGNGSSEGSGESPNTEQED